MPKTSSKELLIPGQLVDNIRFSGIVSEASFNNSLQRIILNLTVVRISDLRIILFTNSRLHAL